MSWRRETLRWCAAAALKYVAAELKNQAKLDRGAKATPFVASRYLSGRAVSPLYHWKYNLGFKALHGTQRGDVVGPVSTR
jgi:hypothetical protein